LINHHGDQAPFDTTTPACRLVLDDGLSLKQATLAGAGIAINSLWSVRDALNAGTLIRVLPNFTVADGTKLWLIYPKANVLSAKVRVFIDFLREEIGQQPPWQ
ncbi:MAG: LysR substrate-binding domain-containing protein, partial [Pseudomonadota bacterium]